MGNFVIVGTVALTTLLRLHELAACKQLHKPTYKRRYGQTAARAAIRKEATEARVGYVDMIRIIAVLWERLAGKKCLLFRCGEGKECACGYVTTYARMGLGA